MSDSFPKESALHDRGQPWYWNFLEAATTLLFVFGVASLAIGTVPDSVSAALMIYKIEPNLRF